MKIYQTAGCPFAHRARIVLEEKKLPYEVVYFEPRSRPAELTALSPDAKSPTLFDSAANARVWDSQVVVEYLDERYPDVPLMPTDAPGRARARILMKEADGKLFPSMGPVIEEVVFKPANERNEARVQEALARFREGLVPWDARLQSQPFLLGEAFTLADITLFTPIVALGRLPIEGRDVTEALTSLRAWRDRIAARPSTAY